MWEFFISQMARSSTCPPIYSWCSRVGSPNSACSCRRRAHTSRGGWGGGEASRGGTKSPKNHKKGIIQQLNFSLPSGTEGSVPTPTPAPFQGRSSLPPLPPPPHCSRRSAAPKSPPRESGGWRLRRAMPPPPPPLFHGGE